MPKVEDKLLDHNFDGIQEYNNPMPPWWTYLFLITIIWAGLYLFYYDISGIGPSSTEEYTQEMKDYQLKYASILSVLKVTRSRNCERREASKEFL